MKTKLLSPQELFFLPVQYEVPEFQRKYVWNKESQWEPLWEDITDLAENLLLNSKSEDTHFLGAVVLQPNATSGDMARGIIIDGQQRLTTLQLMIDAVEEVLRQNGHTTESEKLKPLIENADAFIGQKPDSKFKLWPTVFDQQAFRSAMHDQLDPYEFRSSSVVQAHEFFKTQTQNWLNAQSALDKEIEKIAVAIGQAIRLHLQLVVIDLGSEDPHLIFETMNARGTPLLQSDMVKNSILHEAKAYSGPTELDEGRTGELWSFDKSDADYWMQYIGRGFNRRPRIDVFLNHWLTFRNRKLTRHYREFETFRKYSKQESNSDLDIFDIAEDLDNIGKIYRNIDQCTVEGIEPFLQRCRVMDLGAFTPLLFWLLTHESLKQQNALSNCIKILESYIVRRAVCGLSARSYVNLGEHLLQYLEEALEPPEVALRDYLSKQTASSELWPNDEQFKRRFEEDPLYHWMSRGRLRMVLVAIEERLRTKYAEEKIVVNAEKLNIEHIMPVSWTENWPLQDSDVGNLEAIEIRNNVIHTIGNLTLVFSRFNPVLSNKAWSEKREAMEQHSVLQLNRLLVKRDQWDETTIRERSTWLFEQARRIWPYSNQVLD